MGESFEDLGLRTELARALEAAGFAEPTALQKATIPLLRRGGNAVVHGSSGAGVTAAWGLPILTRLAEGAEQAESGGEEAAEPAEATGLKALAIAPTADEAGQAAAQLAPFAAAAGVRLGALAPGWARPSADTELVVATARDALEAVERSGLKLEGLAAFVVTGLSSVFAFRGTDALDTLSASVPRDAQRVVTTAQLSPEVDGYVERHVRKAMSIPPRPAEQAPAPAPSGEVAYAVVREDEKLDRVARTLEPGTVLFCRSDEGAAAVAEALMYRGFRVGAAEDGESDVDVASAGASPEDLNPRRPLSYDVPASGAQLLARHGGRGGEVLVLPRELPHLRQIAAEAGIALKPAVGPRASTEGLEAFRRRLLDAARSEDLDAQLLVLEPLFQEWSPAEIAAAASALLRRRGPAQAPAGAQAGSAPERAREAAPRGAAGRTPRPGPGAGAAPAAFTRLFVSIGQKDNVRPGDLVGTIAGEAGIPGDRVGKIEVRDTFSIVEVPAEVADTVIRAVNGTTIKGRSVRVDYDRRGATQRAPGRPGRLRRE